MKISNKKTNILVSILLIILFFSSIFSLKDDSATIDEAGFIVAGYTYLTKSDYRFDATHPPIIEDLATFPLLFFKDLQFPENHPAWDAQGDKRAWLGSDFLYRLGNNADKMLLYSRLPMVFLLIFLGWFIFFWTKKLAGNNIALLVLFLFSFSPNFLANGRIVGTDIAAVLGIVLATYFYLRFLKKPNRKNILITGLILGLAFLLKFSTLVLIPFFIIITFIFCWLKSYNLKKILKYIGFGFLIGLIAFLLISLVYQLHMLNYPVERQIQDSEFYLSPGGLTSLENLCLWMVSKPIFRPFAHYFFGVLINLNVAAGGSDTVTYFLGDLYRSVGAAYYPFVYLIKVPLAFHILTLMALMSILWGINKSFFKKIRKHSKEWMLKHFTEVSMIVFVIIYYLTVITNKANIGVRHLLPIFPFLYILVCYGLKNLINKAKGIKFKKIVLFSSLILFLWYGIGSLLIYPHYFSYFNILAGGPKSGYKLVSDGNIDLGQDLKRLAKWVEKQEIKKIYVDYFGDSDIKYYLGEKGIPWYGSSWWNWFNLKQEPKDFPRKNYLAVSATFLQGGWGKPGADRDKKIFRDYTWLDDYKPIAKIGNSIFVYYIN